MINCGNNLRVGYRRINFGIEENTVTSEHYDTMIFYAFKVVLNKSACLQYL